MYKRQEYAYAVGTSQPDVPITIQEARASPEAAEWTAAAEREIESLKERKVYKQTPEQASVQAPDGPHLKLRRQ